MDLINILGHIFILQCIGLFLLLFEVVSSVLFAPLMNKLKITKLNPLDPFNITGKDVTLNAVLILLLIININALLADFLLPLLSPVFHAIPEEAFLQLLLLK